MKLPTVNQWGAYDLLASDDIRLLTACDDLDLENIDAEFNGTEDSWLPYLIRTMRHNAGVAISANQVGIMKKVFVMDNFHRLNIKVFVNPTIVKTMGRKKLMREACLSHSEATYKRFRYPHVVVHGYNRIGEEFNFDTRKAPGTEACKQLYAQAIQHEMDHLEGRDPRKDYK